MAHCFPAAGKWRRESKNPRRKRGKPVDFSSNPGTGLAWKSVQAILKGAVYPRERPRNLARERVEEELSFRKVFYFSADIYALFSPFYISLLVPTSNLNFLSNLEIHKLTQPRDSSNWFIRYTVNHRKDEYVRRSTTNSGIAFEQRTGKRDFVIARCELVLHILFTQLRYAP